MPTSSRRNTKVTSTAQPAEPLVDQPMINFESLPKEAQQAIDEQAWEAIAAIGPTLVQQRVIQLLNSNNPQDITRLVEIFKTVNLIQFYNEAAAIVADAAGSTPVAIQAGKDK